MSTVHTAYKAVDVDKFPAWKTCGDCPMKCDAQIELALEPPRSRQVTCEYRDLAARIRADERQGWRTHTATVCRGGYALDQTRQGISYGATHAGVMASEFRGYVTHRNIVGQQHREI